MKSERSIGIDAVRCIAISMIVLFHYLSTLRVTNTFASNYPNGTWGCVGTSMFFIVSGMVLRMHYRGTFKIGNFYKKRWLSLFPLFYFGYIIFYAYYVIIKRKFFWGGAPWTLIFSLFGIDSYVSFFDIKCYNLVGEWFTAVIILLYILYPLLSKCIEKIPVITTVVLTSLYAINLSINLPFIIDDINPITGLWLFWIGMLLSQYDSIIKKMHMAVLLPLSAVAVVLTFVKLPWHQLLWQNLLGFVLFIIIYKVFDCVKSQKVKKLFISFSKNSYAIYLFHHMIIHTIFSLFKNRLQSPVNITIGFFVSYIVIIVASCVLRMICDRIMKIIKLDRNQKKAYNN